MAKHAGERSRRRPPALPRGAAWGLGAFLLVGALTVVAVARGVAGHDTADLSATTSGAGNQAQTQARERQPQGHPAEKQAQKDGPSRRRPVAPTSRAHAVRPSVAPYHVKSGPTLTLKPTVVLARKVADLSPASSTFTIAQSNILGSNHTMGKNSGFAPGTVRAGMTASLLMFSAASTSAACRRCSRTSSACCRAGWRGTRSGRLPR